LDLAGEVADGVIMNYLISPSATTEAAAIVAGGRARAGAASRPFERWQLIACSVDDDRRNALDAARPLVTRALAFQSHIVAASGVDPELIETIASRLTFPATDAAVAEVAPLVPDDVVTSLTASGTPDDCRAALDRYRDAGCDHPILFPMDDGVDRLIRAFR
jgi:5,10-methylenetetrahydromethanopterin reductase